MNGRGNVQTARTFSRHIETQTRLSRLTRPEANPGKRKIRCRLDICHRKGRTTVQTGKYMQQVFWLIHNPHSLIHAVPNGQVGVWTEERGSLCSVPRALSDQRPLSPPYLDKRLRLKGHPTPLCPQTPRKRNPDPIVFGVRTANTRIAIDNHGMHAQRVNVCTAYVMAGWRSRAGSCR